MARYQSFVYQPNFLAGHSQVGLSSSKSTYQSHYARPLRSKSAAESSLTRLGVGLVSCPSPFEKQAPSPFTKPVVPRHGWGKKPDPPASNLSGLPEELVAAGRISIEEYRARILSEKQQDRSSPQHGV
mmetsp:Transcript_47505/g.88909  ORF Transcript_47505/g.88909 Transcript_47505/m.88909 type:complete len:128 (+) Transcript_47505:28-411(+)